MVRGVECMSVLISKGLFGGEEYSEEVLLKMFIDLSADNFKAFLDSIDKDSVIRIVLLIHDLLSSVNEYLETIPVLKNTLMKIVTSKMGKTSVNDDGVKKEGFNPFGGGIFG